MKDEEGKVIEFKNNKGQTKAKIIATSSGYTREKNYDYAVKQVYAKKFGLPLHEKPYLPPDERTIIHDYADKLPGGGTSDQRQQIMGWERFRHEKSFEATSSTQGKLLEAKDQNNLELEREFMAQRQEQALATANRKVTNEVIQDIEGYVKKHGVDKDLIEQWERYNEKSIAEAKWRKARATLSKYLMGAFAVGGAAYTAASLSTGSWDPVHWFYE